MNKIFKDWLQQALSGDRLSDENLRNRFKSQAKTFSAQAKRTADSLHKSRLFDYVSELDFEDLELLIETYVLETEMPQTYDQGLELLAESGINLK